MSNKPFNPQKFVSFNRLGFFKNDSTDFGKSRDKIVIIDSSLINLQEGVVEKICLSDSILSLSNQLLHQRLLMHRATLKYKKINQLRKFKL